MFKLPKHRLYTWKSSADKIDETIVRNQIDYIRVLIINRFKNSVTSAKTYPGTDFSSDHNPLVAKFRILLRALERNIFKQKIGPIS